MAEFTKERGGAWAKASELTNGSRAKIVDEATKSLSQFRDEDGNAKMQTVAKVRFEGVADPLNVNLNRATVYGLIDAFGTESKNWIGHVLKVHTEKTTVAGKRVTALYLVPEGFEVGEDDNGYVIVRKVGVVVHGPEAGAPKEEVTPDDIPF
jgi:hypothetical protein